MIRHLGQSLRDCNIKGNNDTVTTTAVANDNHTNNHQIQKCCAISSEKKINVKISIQQMKLRWNINEITKSSYFRSAIEKQLPKLAGKWHVMSAQQWQEQEHRRQPRIPVNVFFGDRNRFIK